MLDNFVSGIQLKAGPLQLAELFRSKIDPELFLRGESIN